MRQNHTWRDGNSVELLINGEDFYPRVFECIRNAREEVLLETFIITEDKIGRQLQQALIAAAKAGARVEVMVDGYGTFDLSTPFLTELVDAGVTLRVFDPSPRMLGMRTNMFRRLHRKIVVVDSKIAYVGGINFSEEHIADFGDMVLIELGLLLARLAAAVARRVDAFRRIVPEQILGELFLQLQVLFLGLAAPPRPGDRMRGGPAVLHRHQRLRTRADDRKAVKIEEVEERRRVYAAERPVDETEETDKVFSVTSILHPRQANSSQMRFTSLAPSVSNAARCSSTSSTAARSSPRLRQSRSFTSWSAAVSGGRPHAPCGPRLT